MHARRGHGTHAWYVHRPYGQCYLVAGHACLLHIAMLHALVSYCVVAHTVHRSSVGAVAVHGVSCSISQLSPPYQRDCV
jgi:hypothetical protein